MLRRKNAMGDHSDRWISPLKFPTSFLSGFAAKPPVGLGGAGAGSVRCPSYPCCSTEDVAMRNFDLGPLWRSSVGFDRLFDREPSVRAGGQIPALRHHPYRRGHLPHLARGRGFRPGGYHRYRTAKHSDRRWPQVLHGRTRHVQCRYARHCRPAGVEGHITCTRIASEPGISRVWPSVIRVGGPHREGEEP